ncbi:hypothetical protein SGLAM104S_07574 [Streptomyces glaucescens]
MNRLPSADVLEKVRDIPIYRFSVELGHFPILEKPEIARGFPDNWMTPELARALEAGEAEFLYCPPVPTTLACSSSGRPTSCSAPTTACGSEHPDLGASWHAGARRVSLTTVLATEHVGAGERPQARGDSW